jgi:hypothetical protein
MRETPDKEKTRHSTAGGGFDREYKQIVSTFNDVVTLHMVNLVRILGVVGSSCPNGSFRTLETVGRTGRAGSAKPFPKRSVMDLICSARELSQVAVESKLQ